MPAKTIQAHASASLKALDEALAPAPDRPTRPLPFLREQGADPLAALLAFHAEIRRSLDLLDDLAQAPEFDDKERALAYTLWEFFTGPLLWHDIDEELSVLKRLRGQKMSTVFEALIDEVHANHEDMEAQLQALRPHLERLIRGDAPEAGAFAAAAFELRAILDPHLALEEHEIFPFARYYFSDDAREEIRAEIDERMRARGETA